ncbi:hypothetical protein LQR31_20150 [Chromobacterium vaccinii]|uniref:hypothetical protein n=1 Tax=Chromobacterium vaccinii TaxID=1108595 RepID=UPI001E313C41|nr:hypothetical protein [Chromobacterium vaccinii]MCD4486787.1 hypothetical protein [Chromobacterium vaccinii]
MSNTEPIYKNTDALLPIEKILIEADAALTDKNRTSSTENDINEALVAAGGIGVGGTIGFAGLYYAGVTGLSAAGITSALAAAGGLVGGGMAAGVAVLAAPAVLLGIGAYAWAAQRNKQKLIERKKELLSKLLDKHKKIAAELRKFSPTNGDRIEYLERLNILIKAAIADLETDMKIHAS